MRNRRAWAGFALLVPALAGLAGCHGAIVGKWRLAEAVPNRHTIAIDHVAFNRDGTYSAAVTNEGRTTKETGRYKFNGFKLELLPKAGGYHAYTATVAPGQITLLSMEDTSRKVVIRSTGS